MLLSSVSYDVHVGMEVYLLHMYYFVCVWARARERESEWVSEFRKGFSKTWELQVLVWVLFFKW